MTTNTHLSLFSGAGGLDIGLKMAGWNTVAFIENNKDCQKTLQQNMPHSTIYSDVTSFNIEDFRLQGIRDLD